MGSESPFPYKGRRFSYNTKSTSSLFERPRRKGLGRTRQDRIDKFIAARRKQKDRTTVGVEFEFLLAVKTAQEAVDPHPEETRWHARKLAPFSESSAEFRITVRNEIIDKLRERGVIAVKSWNDTELVMNFKPSTEFSWTYSKEQDLIRNSTKIMPFAGEYRWDYSQDNKVNISVGANHWLDQFEDFHKENSLEFHHTLDEDIDLIQERQLYVNYKGPRQWPKTAQFNLARKRFRECAKNRTLEVLGEYEKRVSEEVDPNAIDIHGSNPLYRAWTCGVDLTIMPDDFPHDECMRLYRVLKDSDSIPDSYLSFNEDGSPLLDKDGYQILSQNPLKLYSWYQGELRTPILDYNHWSTMTAIRKACAALRDAFCIHKPMSVIRTGLHIHFGQEQAWTLLHLKKFATFWLILEEMLETLHRRDRSDNSNNYCLPNRERCPIIVALENFTTDCLSTIESTDPEAYERNMDEMSQYVPFSPFVRDIYDLSDDIRDIVHEVWKYQSITELSGGMSGDAFLYVKFRIYGDTVSVMKEKDTETLEIRLMQGTLDADHIERWMKICERIIMFSRDASNVQFRDGINRLLRGSVTLEEITGLPLGYLDWFRDRQGDSGYFEYPDKDRVNWDNLFMPPGHGATHNPES